MTCIIGFTDREKNISWIGSDSLSSNGYTNETNMASKVFRNSTFQNLLMGGTTSFRHLDLLKYSTDLFDELDIYKTVDIDHKFMVTKFIPRVISLFKNGVVSENEKDRGGIFIVAAPGRLFKIQYDYSVLEPELGICAVGCGEHVAMGSLLTTRDLDIPPQDKIIKALGAAEQYCDGVRRPFRILCTNGNDEIIIR